MPCFKGLAVSIHTPDGPIAEYSIQKQSRLSRISSFIPVPDPRVPANSITGKVEQSTFAVSITLLTPGLNVPYSTPKPTPEDPHPKPRTVGSLPGITEERGNYSSTVPPFIPRTHNPNETIAAYIYFDGRIKEEVATLLRRGEETWVNSRWVSVPESEGGGLAEREFLFREVGLERWLNGLDLEGSKDQKAERIERRQRRLEKRRQRGLDNSDDDSMTASSPRKTDRNGVLRYGGGENGSPVEEVMDDNGLFSSSSDSDDDPPQPEAAGQIKIALFRVLASGEIKRGEYSPQFDAHDDDDEGMDPNGTSNGDADVDHTTSFAKPKTLDPKSISTQTVTGLDPTESPYAVFTFFYRSKKQLQKMGILQSAESAATPGSSKRKQSGPDFSNLGPLKTAGTVGFSGYRDSNTSKRKDKNKDADAMDSDADDDDDEDEGDKDVSKELETEGAGENGKLLSPEDAKRQGELAEGVQKIKLKRQHSAEPLADANATRKSPYVKSSDSPPAGTPQSTNSTAAVAGTPPSKDSPPPGDEPLGSVASPYKRQRPSLSGLESSLFTAAGSAANDGAGSDIKTQEPGLPASTYVPSIAEKLSKVDSDEEL